VYGKSCFGFEKPVVELEQKIEEMRKLSDNLDIAMRSQPGEKSESTSRKYFFEPYAVAKVQLAVILNVPIHSIISV